MKPAASAQPFKTSRHVNGIDHDDDQSLTLLRLLHLPVGHKSGVPLRVLRNVFRFFLRRGRLLTLSIPVLYHSLSHPRQ